MQLIVMSSDKTLHTLKGFFWCWEKYAKQLEVETVVCGFTPPTFDIPADFYSIGNFEDYPHQRWTDSFIKVLNNVADETFLFLMDDFWINRKIDVAGMTMMFHYMYQFTNVIKFDPTRERLFADGGGKYLFGYNTYASLGYLDLIKSDHGSMYHMSLWGGLFRRDLLKEIVVFGETAQALEINGTRRLSQYGDEMLVLGSRNAPLMHTNVVQRSEWNQDPMTGLPALDPIDLQELKELGHV